MSNSEESLLVGYKGTVIDGAAVVYAPYAPCPSSPYPYAYAPLPNSWSATIFGGESYPYVTIETQGGFAPWQMPLSQQNSLQSVLDDCCGEVCAEGWYHESKDIGKIKWEWRIGFVNADDAVLFYMKFCSPQSFSL